MPSWKRGLSHICLDVFTIGSSVAGACFMWQFRLDLSSLKENYGGDITSSALPCIRPTLADQCPTKKTDECQSRCCPKGYYCTRSALAGLYCQDSAVACGNFRWCRDYADFTGDCGSPTCKSRELVSDFSYYSAVACFFAICCDLVDVLLVFAGLCVSPDFVKFKSMDDIASSLLKLLAFGLVILPGTHAHMEELEEAACFNADGLAMVSSARRMFVLYCIAMVFSGFASLLEAPLNAYYGGHRLSTPYVKAAF